MGEILARFVIGGVVVSVFALIGDVIKPKSFAGLFGAAPSVALALTNPNTTAPSKATQADKFFEVFMCASSMRQRVP